MDFKIWERFVTRYDRMLSIRSIRSINSSMMDSRLSVNRPNGSQ